MSDLQSRRVGFTPSLPVLLLTAFVGSVAAQSPRLVLDAAPGATGSMAGAVFSTVPSARAGEVFLILDDGVHGTELWRSDGTAGGTSLVLDMTPGIAGTSFASVGTQVDGLWFVIDLPNGPELWRTDGTATGTVRVLDGIALNATTMTAPLFRFADGSFVLDIDGTLARSDGTVAGTRTLAVPSGPIYDAGGGALWVFDRLMRDLWRIPASSTTGTRVATGLRSLTPALGGMLVTRATASGGTDLQVLGVTPSPQTTLSEDVIVIARHDDVLALGTTGLWRWDGQAAPVLLRSFASLYDPITSAGFYAFRFEDLSMLFFPNDGVHGHEPWWTDGTPAGTRLLVDLTPGPTSTIVWPGFSVDDRIVFWAQTPNLGNEPWTTDGTPAGTALLGDLEPGPGSSYTDSFRGTGGIGWRRVVLPIMTSAFGSELWISDGTSAGTRMLADSHPGPGSSIQPYNYWSQNAGSSLIVPLDDGTHGIEPHAVDLDGTISWLPGNCSTKDRYLVRDPVLGTPWRLEARDVAIGGLALLALPATTPLLFDTVCAVQLDVATSVPLAPIVPDATGHWSAMITLPGSPSLAGASVATQAAFLDPTRPNGFVVADAWLATLGV